MLFSLFFKVEVALRKTKYFFVFQGGETKIWKNSVPIINLPRSFSVRCMSGFFLRGRRFPIFGGNRRLENIFKRQETRFDDYNLALYTLIENT